MQFFNLLAFVPLLSATTNAFMVSIYETSTCTATGTTLNVTVESGCQNDWGNLATVKSEWDTEMDNKVMIALYSEELCCDAAKIQTITWTDGCFEVMSDARSFRVVDPDSPDTGKEGEVYTC